MACSPNPCKAETSDEAAGLGLTVVEQEEAALRRLVAGLCPWLKDTSRAMAQLTISPEQSPDEGLPGDGRLPRAGRPLRHLEVGAGQKLRRLARAPGDDALGLGSRGKDGAPPIFGFGFGTPWLRFAGAGIATVGQVYASAKLTCFGPIQDRR